MGTSLTSPSPNTSTKSTLDPALNSMSANFFTTVYPMQDARKALTKSEEDGLRAAETVQRLEEELEVADARWKAAQGQLIAAARREKRCVL